ncbi:hypothetical protein FOVSG1_011950 [Fusarium oxysporum f. sp. vasinfectum]
MLSMQNKHWVIATGMWVTWNSNLGSSLPSGSIDILRRELGVESVGQIVWLNSLYLLGYAFGPLVFGPLSEYIGRRPVILYTYIGYLSFTLACALSNSYGLLLFFRFCTGVAGSAPNAVVGGLFADIYDNHQERGRAMLLFIFAAVLGPLFGPLISGFASMHSWQLSFWIGFGIAGIGLPLVLLLPETFAPVLREREQAARADMSFADRQVIAMSSGRVAEELKIVFGRPASMMIQEPVVLFTSLYLALIYSILYLFFQGYSIIFQRVYGLSPSLIGLGYLPIMAGALLGMLLVILYDNLVRSRQRSGESWAWKECFRRLPPACVGGLCVVGSLFYLGWTSTSGLHPAVPMMSGIGFGAGYFLIFVAMINYLTDAYKVFAASANAAASTTRSIVAAFLPLAASPLFTNLGVSWACTLLGFLALVASAVPFVFLKYGQELRKRSPFCQKLAEDEAGHQVNSSESQD